MLVPLFSYFLLLSLQIKYVFKKNNCVIVIDFICEAPSRKVDRSSLCLRFMLP